MGQFDGLDGSGSLFKSIAEEANNKYLSYQTFVKKMKKALTSGQNEYSKELDPIQYGGKIVICDEPLTFIKKVTRCRTSQEKEKAFLRLCENFRKVDISRAPDDSLWFNSTKNGINLRPGAMNDMSTCVNAVTLGDTCVHGMVVGRTGSGKSVFLNNLIFNLITEYPPWELDLYLADFKKVELSRYMSRDNYMTPHVCACAATSEIRYVVSMFQYLVECMKARQNLFSSLGVLKLSELREKYEVVLPRVLLLVDEFQQLFLEATPREAAAIQEILTAITKLGRATGFHLLFASQEMSGTLSSKDFANFKAKFALPCDAEVSSTVLGNTEAAKIEEKGKILVNTKSGRAEDNISYRVPFINDKEKDTGKMDSEGNPARTSEFFDYLHMIHQQAQNYPTFSKIHKFYQEDEQGPMERIAELKEDNGIKAQITKVLSGNPALTECLILGSAVVFRNKKSDYESVFIEAGRRKNIGVICNNYEDCANILKLLAENFKHSGHTYMHRVIQQNDIIRDLYDLEADLHAKIGRISDPVQRMNGIRDAYNRDKKVIDLIVANKESKAFLLAMGDEFMAGKVNSSQSELEKDWKRFFESNFSDTPAESLEERLDEVRKMEQATPYAKLLDMMSRPVKYFCEYYKGKKITQILPRNIVWVIGMENMEYKASEFSKMLKDSTEYNWLFILAGSSDENMTECYRCCNYLFVNTPDSRIYDRYRMHFTRKSSDSPAIDFKICNMEVERSFKKFDVELNELVVPEVDFDVYDAGNFGVLLWDSDSAY